MLTRASQQNQNTLVRHTHAGNPSFDNLVSGISQALQNAGLEATVAMQQAYGRIMAMLQLQATTLAYVYVKVITLMAIIVACLIPLPMIMRRPPRGKPSGEVAMH